MLFVISKIFKVLKARMPLNEWTVSCIRNEAKSLGSQINDDGPDY